MSRFEKPWYTPAILAFIGEDLPRWTGLPPTAFARDVIRLEQRLTDEGESFLTKTLPALGSQIDLALQGHVPLISPGFKKFGRTSRPAFLQALTRRVFKDDGWLADEPCIVSIRLLRQLCFWCKKLEKGYSDESLQKAVLDIINVEDALPPTDAVLVGSHLGVARSIIEHMFLNIMPLDRHTPKHGPGAVASGETGPDKRRLDHCYSDLESVFRPIPWFFSLRDAAEDPQRVVGRIKCKYGLSRIAFVEKDSRGPRVIGLEPAEYMWVQQAIKSWMYNHIETRSIAKGQVNFTDQTINRELARDWKEWETLDMSKASDRNSYALVRQLFQRTRLWPYLHASRTPGTVLPDGDVLLFKKFAPMGSAVCFPVQASVYYALACATLHLQGMPLVLALSRVFVYGDDLVVPRGYYEALDHTFRGVGLKFNDAKCCIHGKFRESCGMDAYDGVEVTPVRMRRAYEQRGRTVYPSIVEHANALHTAGYWGAAVAFRGAALRKYPRLKGMRIPYSPRGDEPILCWLDNELDTVRIRYKHWIPQVKGWVYEPLTVPCPAAGESRYYRESLSLGGPVGLLKGPANRRFMARKYEGVLRYRSIPYWPR